MRSISDKQCTEKPNTIYMSKNILFENRAFYEIMWKNIVQPDRPKDDNMAQALCVLGN
jgi:hypothetical protein